MILWLTFFDFLTECSLNIFIFCVSHLVFLSFGFCKFHTIIYIYLMGPFNAGPYSALFLGAALISAGVRRAGVEWAILKMQ